MSPDDVARTLESENVKRLNDDALAHCMMSFSLVLPRHGQGWRACMRTRGNLPGLEHVGELEILCTDGIVAFYTITATSGLFYGHTAGFTGEVKPFASLSKKESSATAKPGARVSKKREATVSLALSLLSKLTQKKPLA